VYGFNRRTTATTQHTSHSLRQEKVAITLSHSIDATPSLTHSLTLTPTPFNMTNLIETQIKQLQSDLEKALAKPEPTAEQERVTDILTALDALPITSSLIVSSKIANTINATKKKYANESNGMVKGKCKELIQKWKNIYKNETAGSAATVTVTTTTTTTTTTTATATATATTVAAVCVDTSDAVNASEDTKKKLESPSNRGDLDDAEDCESMIADYPEGRKKVNRQYL
jgi:hypothetical protein